MRTTGHRWWWGGLVGGLTVVATMAAPLQEPPISVVGLLHDARLAVGDTNLILALDLSARAVRLDPAYGESWKQQGRVLMLMHRPEEAMRSLVVADRLQPEDEDLAWWRLGLLHDLGRYQELVATVEALPAEKARGMDEGLLARILGDMFDHGEPLTAGRLAARWSNLTTQHTSRVAAQAMVLIIGRDLETARHTLETMKPNQAGEQALAALAYHRLGLAYLEQRQNGPAVKAFESALTFDPERLATWRDLGWALRASGQTEQAVTWWKRGVAANPKAREWLTWIADTYLEQGKAAEAGQAADQLLADQPDHEQARLQKLAALLMAGSASAPAYEEALKTDPNGERIILLAHTWADRYAQNYEQAAEKLEKYCRDVPTDKEARRLLVDTYNRWASTLSRRDAFAPLERALQIDPENPACMRDLGWAYWARGERDRSVTLLDRAIQSGVANRDDVIIQVFAGLAESGQEGRALELLKQWAPGVSMLDIGRRLFEQGRLVAAEPVLELAWGNQEDPPTCGYLLGFTRALNGHCGDLQVYLEPLLRGSLSSSSPETIDSLYEAVAICGERAESFALMERLNKETGGRPGYATRVTELIENGADRRRVARDYSHALRLYRRVLARDPNRLCYLRAADCAEALGRRSTAISLLMVLGKQANDEAVRQGVAGKLAEYRYDLRQAAELYQQSLQAQPEQVDVRRALFSVLVRQGRLDEAREQATWFVQQYEAGRLSVRTEIAEMWTVLGETEDALDFWTALSAAHPESSYYVVEQARALYRLGRPAEAEALIRDLNQRSEDVRAYEILAEIHAAQARPDLVLGDTEKGLTVEVTRDLVRLRAEAAEALRQHAIACEMATTLLQEDPGNQVMARMKSRALMGMGSNQAARTFLRELTNRNPAQVQALISLRELAVRERAWGEAVKLSETVVRQRPWDLDAVRRYSMSLNDNRQFKKSVELLQRHVKTDQPPPTLAALVYRDVISGPYPGRNTPAQVATHVEQLAAAGYQFLTPDQVNLKSLPRKKSVLLIIADTDARSLADIDQALAKHGARATYAGFTTRETRALPGRPTQAQVQALQQSGRWAIASSGPLALPRIVIDAQGTLGNALCQRQLNSATGATESNDEMHTRVDELLNDMAAPLDESARVLLYPRGDYGQLALDTDGEALQVLQQAVASHFALAFASDEAGFISEPNDPHRLPAKNIPPGWTAEALLAHLAANHPDVNLQVQYARTLNMNRQPQEAAAWFQIALANGARNLNLDAAGKPEAESSAMRERRLMAALGMGTNDMRVVETLHELRPHQEGRVQLQTSYTEDREDRRTARQGAEAFAQMAQTVRLDGLAEFQRWKKTGEGQEDGLRTGAGVRWYLRPDVWLDGRLWWMDYEQDTLDDFWGGFLRVRVPQAAVRGEINLEASRSEIGTVEAIRQAVRQWQYNFRSTSRLGDRIDLLLNGSYVDRDDENDSRVIDGRLLWRARENPYLGVGLAGQVADSRRDPAAYYAPMEVHQYQVVGQARGRLDRFTYSGSVQAGLGREQYIQWRMVWGADAQLEYALWRQLYLFSECTYQETATYDHLQVRGGLGQRF